MLGLNFIGESGFNVQANWGCKEVGEKLEREKRDQEVIIYKLFRFV